MKEDEWSEFCHRMNEIYETTKIQIEKVYPVNYQKTANGWRL